MAIRAPATGGTGGTGGTGPVGPAGPIGPRGFTGADGRSAYQVWLDAGNIGTVVQYIATLTGDKGEKGDTGAPGAASTVAGPAGAKGDTGATGAPGAASTVPGPVGPAGPASTVGASSMALFDGLSGASLAFVIPAGITRILAELWSAGGRGLNGGNGTDLTGGGGGGYLRAYLTVVPGETLTVRPGYSVQGGSGQTSGRTFVTRSGEGGTVVLASLDGGGTPTNNANPGNGGAVLSAPNPYELIAGEHGSGFMSIGNGIYVPGRGGNAPKGGTGGTLQRPEGNKPGGGSLHPDEDAGAGRVVLWY